MIAVARYRTLVACIAVLAIAAGWNAGTFHELAAQTPAATAQTAGPTVFLTRNKGRANPPRHGRNRRTRRSAERVQVAQHRPRPRRSIDRGFRRQGAFTRGVFRRR